MSVRWIKYGTQSDIRFSMVKRAVVDLAVSADWTPAAADSAISKDGGNYADTTNTVAVVGGSPTRSVAGWKLTISSTEAQAAELNIQIVDAATKAVEDNFIAVYTYGNASAKFAGDWSDLVRLGLTALPNAAAEAAGGLYTRGSGAGQINQNANGQVDSRAVAISNGVIAAATFAANALDAVWSTAARVLTAGTNIVLAKGVGVTGFTDLDAAGVRTAVGLASANLDTQLAAIAAYIDTEVQSILDKVGTTGVVLTAAERNAVADALLARSMGNARTVKEALSFLRNKWTVAGGTLTVYDTDDSAVLWTATIGSDAAALPVVSSDPA